MAANIRLTGAFRRFYSYSSKRQSNLKTNLTRNVSIYPKTKNPTVAAPFGVYSDWELAANIKDPCYDTVDLSFENTAEAYKSKTNFDIARALLVFNLCSIRPVVENNKQVRLHVKLPMLVSKLYRM